MKKRVLQLLVLCSGIMYPLFTNAQISEGGLPPSFDFPDTRENIPQYEATVDFDVAKLLKEDAELESLGNPPRCAKIIPVNLNMIDNGEWLTLPDGTWVWQLEIFAPDALAIMLYYEKFIIPEGGKLFLYNPDHSKILGAYNENTNTKGAEFATEFVSGDRIIFEYVAPPTDEMLIPQIEITGIAYGYNHLGKDILRIGESEPCMININCSEGDDWQDQKKGVARIVIPTGEGYVGFCSGTLINNTANNRDPLFLSAFHCYEGSTAVEMNQAVYYFHYENPECERLNTTPNSLTIIGAEYLVELPINGASDGALVRLNSAIPESYDVYFNGWDRTSSPASSGVGIHHPAGDVKKISTFTTRATTQTWHGEGNTHGAPNAHWNIRFAATENGHSVTEGGSSGSPMFNQNKLVVGTLSGGNSSCKSPNGVNLYGKLWYHWNQGTQKMNQYLDPTGTGAETLNGTYRSTNADFHTEEEELYVIRPVRFINTSVNDVSWAWTFEGGVPATSNEQNPPEVTYNAAGTYSVTLTINSGLGDEMTKEFEFDVVVKENLCSEETEIGNGTVQTQFPLGSLNRQTFSSSIYKASEFDLDSRGYINKISWNTANASATQRKVYIYLKETDDDSFTNTTAWSDEIEDAILVYEGATDWTNNAGWVTFELAKPFRYSGNRNLKLMVRTMAAAGQEYASSNCYSTTSTACNIQWISDTQNIPADLGTINNDRPNVRFDMGIPCGLNAPVADFNMNNSSDNTIEIFRDDTVSFQDLSTGPVANWNWTFEGGNPETSLESEPVILYHNKGTFSVNMSVDNTLGTNSKSKTIVVKTKTPEAGFASYSEKGFTSYPNYGQFLPYQGGEVSFTDKTENYPDTRTWQLAGVNQSSDTDEIINAVYPAGNTETSYSVSLSVSNEAGSDELSINNYVQVGGSGKIWNIPHGDVGNSHFESSLGRYLTGVNSDYSAIAEKFTTSYSGSVSKVDLMIKAMEGNVTNRTYYVMIYADNEGKPGTLIGSSKSFKGSDINPDGYTTIEFDQPIPVSGTFYVAVSGLTYNAAKIAIASSNEKDECTVYGFLRAGNWELLSNIYAEKEWKVSLNVVLHFTYDGGSNITDNISDNNLTIYPNPVNDYFIIKSGTAIQSVFVQDMQGRRIVSLTGMSRNEIKISSVNWAKGIYPVFVKTANGTYSYKLIKN
ncbi:MAG: PKD domain-containing protein [Cytophagaceae bacterium]|jgi:PKD repeat protein|nr:PKD domain-containing protein [Cytophagaceae bacterium]